jgi:large subunit ribosomal protein L35
MPKLKTHKGTSKRIWKSGSGKLLRRHAQRSHHRGRKNVKQLQRRKIDETVPRQNPRIAELIPYNYR